MSYSLFNRQPTLGKIENRRNRKMFLFGLRNRDPSVFRILPFQSQNSIQRKVLFGFSDQFGLVKLCRLGEVRLG
jgi:hypothetical protein